jgi:hypothetical protein
LADVLREFLVSVGYTNDREGQRRLEEALAGVGAKVRQMRQQLLDAAGSLGKVDEAFVRTEEPAKRHQAAMEKTVSTWQNMRPVLKEFATGLTTVGAALTAYVTELTGHLNQLYVESLRTGRSVSALESMRQGFQNVTGAGQEAVAITRQLHQEFGTIAGRGRLQAFFPGATRAGGTQGPDVMAILEEAAKRFRQMPDVVYRQLEAVGIGRGFAQPYLENPQLIARQREQDRLSRERQERVGLDEKTYQKISEQSNRFVGALSNMLDAMRLFGVDAIAPILEPFTNGLRRATVVFGDVEKGLKEKYGEYAPTAVGALAVGGTGYAALRLLRSMLGIGGGGATAAAVAGSQTAIVAELTAANLTLRGILIAVSKTAGLPVAGGPATPPAVPGAAGGWTLARIIGSLFAFGAGATIAQTAMSGQTPDPSRPGKLMGEPNTTLDAFKQTWEGIKSLTRWVAGEKNTPWVKIESTDDPLGVSINNAADVAKAFANSLADVFITSGLVKSGADRASGGTGAGADRTGAAAGGRMPGRVTPALGTGTAASPPAPSLAPATPSGSVAGGRMPGRVAPQGATAPPANVQGGRSFAENARIIMAGLQQKFGLTQNQSAGLVGNLGFESGGLKQMQERRPAIPGSRGGWGWAQWTGPRRDAFEAYAKEHSLDPSSFQANYGYLMHELENTAVGKRTIAALKRAGTLAESVWAGGQTFESPKGTTESNLPGFGSRLKYGQQALGAGTNLGTDNSVSYGDRNVQLQQTHNWNVSGENALSIGGAIRRTQDRVNGDMVRNLETTVR